MVDKEDLYLNIKVNYEGQTMEMSTKDLPNLDNFKNILMDKFDIPNIKDYLYLSSKNRENYGSSDNLIKKDEDLFKYSKETSNCNIYYLELDLNFNFDFFKSKQITNLNQLYQKQKDSEITKEIIEEKKMKIKELQSQISEIKKRNDKIT